MRNGSSAFLIDTTVLVYAHDPRDRKKQEQAFRVLDTLYRQRTGCPQCTVLD